MPRRPPAPKEADPPAKEELAGRGGVPEWTPVENMVRSPPDRLPLPGTGLLGWGGYWIVLFARLLAHGCTSPLSRRPSWPLWVPRRWPRRILCQNAPQFTTTHARLLMLLPIAHALARKTAWVVATPARRSCTRRRCNASRHGTISAFAVMTTSTGKAGVTSHAVATSSSALAQHATEKDVSALFV